MQRRQIEALLRTVSAPDRPLQRGGPWMRRRERRAEDEEFFYSKSQHKSGTKTYHTQLRAEGAGATQRKFTVQKESLLVNWAQTAASSCPVTNSKAQVAVCGTVWQCVLTVCVEQAPPHMMMMMRAVRLLEAPRGSYGGCLRCTCSV